MIKTLIKIFCLAGILFIVSCGGNKTSSKPAVLKIASDESFVKVMDAEIDSFNYIERTDSAFVIYNTESECLRQLFTDSVPMAVISRELSPEEKDFFKKRERSVLTTPIFTDALAIILHPDNADSLFTMDALKKIFSGETKTWKEISGAGSDEEIQIVFDDPKSANARYIADKFLDSSRTTPKNFYAVKSSRGVVDHVSRNKNALGIISVSWISDFDDTETQVFMEKTKVAQIKEKNEYFYPYQAFVAMKKYPLTRTVYLVRSGGGPGIGTRFVNFVSGVGNMPGQLIVQKAGLMPVRGHVRVVEIK